ncbi:uncharacterized protein EDB91DRAFT_1083603 [Suillus paluster]|uniref:uncharacterized protein n=1 Tax=Suillus paluster TaxID=48578 RepID=UPI001B88609C|nr:uncharacterized protein EDB91DRAFT_1083603 [Suillus paluster]KAG1735691.1 hypothetical protein EDB91DRAFT_1083603 [Suillus paluster]
MQMNELIHAYLDYQSRDSGDGIPTVSNENDNPSLNTALVLSNIELVDTFSFVLLQPIGKLTGLVPDSPSRRNAKCCATCMMFALKHDTPNWWLLNACPACTYKLVDESPLQFAWFATIDGNNSLKRWASSSPNSVPRDDSRWPRSDYWISRDAVDKFKDEVRSRTALDKNNKVDDWEDVHNDKEVPGEAIFHCTVHWCNARPEQYKKMFSVFDESSIFIAA